MGTSGNPQKKSAKPQVSSVSDFKKRNGGDITLPSGLVAKLKNPGGLRAFMAKGLIPNSLMPIVQETLQTGQEPDMAKASAKVDQETIEEMMEMMDNIAVLCFVEPRCYPTPDNEADRDDDRLYADEVPDEDKMFVFQWLSGGTADVEQFRAQQNSNVASMAGQPKVGDSAK